jgi:hypothetical protein
MTNTALEHFLHRQIDCWNRGDKAGFLQCYRDVASRGLDIEYVGMPKHDPWLMLEGMWQSQPKIRIEVNTSIVIGDESASHHINRLRGEDAAISTETLELYTLRDGVLTSRIFIKR